MNDTVSQVDAEEVEQALIEAMVELPEDDVLVTSCSTMNADIMGIIINTMKGMPDVWQKMSKETQQDYLDSIDRQVTTTVEKCVKLIAADNRPFVMAKVDQVVFKGGIEAKMKLDTSPHENGAPSGAHELADQQGQMVMIMLPALEQYEISDDQKPQADEDQYDIIDDNDDLLYDDVVEFVIESNTATITTIQRKFKVGYNRASRLMDMLEQHGVVSEISPTGGRTVLAKESEAA
jgi:DNA segregation ATPase FtsK/SpoIIIE-like protein